jgi:hypothetical protein
LERCSASVFTGTGAIVVYVVGLLVLLGTFISQWHALLRWFGRRRGAGLPAEALRVREPTAEPRVLSLQPTGGGTFVDFRAEVAKYGSRPCRCRLGASVDDTAVECSPGSMDLAPTGLPKTVRISVPRPDLGDLIPEFNHETTLYDATLCLRVETDEGVTAEETWHEHVYTEAENRERYAIQQRKWRLGRGGSEPTDLRAEYMSERTRRMAERYDANGREDV